VYIGTGRKGESDNLDEEFREKEEKIGRDK
jgi:hypothetical protein